MIRGSCLCGGVRFEIEANVFVGSKAPWWEIADSLPQHNK